MGLELLWPYVNFLDVDGKKLKLFWCHGTFLRAMAYYKEACYASISFEEILRSISLGYLPEVHQALIYGALSAADPDLTPDKYQKMDIDPIQAYAALLDGVTSYLPLPKPERYEAYSEVEPKSLEVDWSFWFSALKNLNFSVAEIYGLTFRAMEELVVGDMPDDKDDLSWLVGPDPAEV